MSQTDLEHDMLGADKRIAPDAHKLRDLFRQWIEPILAVLVAGLIVAVVILIGAVLDVKSQQAQAEIERDRGRGNVCRFMHALGLDIEQEGDLCMADAVQAVWRPYEHEVTLSVETTRGMLLLLCGHIEAEVGTRPITCPS